MTYLPISCTDALVRALRARTKTQTRRVGARAIRVAVGDRLWLREAFHFDQRFDSASALKALSLGATVIAFAADGVPIDAGRRRFALELPRLCHRYHLVLTGVGNEPLQAITDADVRAEGFADRAAFAASWDVLQGPGKYKIGGARPLWDENPCVTVLSFDFVDAPLPQGEHPA